ncbi:hypothetical protein KCU98_g14909, partial [Aureobasidium melanogenum]
MTLLEIPFDEEDVSHWTRQSVRAYVESSKKKLKAFYLNFFGWSEEEYRQARDCTSAELQIHFDPCKRFPIIGPQAKFRHTAQINLVRDRPDLFLGRHGPNPPAWFDAELISRSPPYTKPFDTRSVVQQFISFSRGHAHERQRRLKRENHAEEDADSDEDEVRCQITNKRPRISRLEEATPFTTLTSTFMPPTSPATITYPQISGHPKPPGKHPNSSKGSNSSGRIATTAGGRSSVSMLGLILYVTRVTIVDQNLVLERDRFGFVDNLFEQGKLVESRIKELVFGNSLDNKPTFLWFFDDTSNDKPRIIRNRPSAEAAIMMLKARAERAQATGIQVFDAPDSDTAALVPVHEVTRKDDFVQRASFELELDDDEDDNEDGRTEEESKVDSAYGSRDGELRLDHESVKNEVDTKPNITWEKQQQANVESESESEEE